MVKVSFHTFSPIIGHTNKILPLLRGKLGHPPPPVVFFIKLQEVFLLFIALARDYNPTRQCNLCLTSNNLSSVCEKIRKSLHLRINS